MCVDFNILTHDASRKVREGLRSMLDPRTNKHAHILKNKTLGIGIAYYCLFLDVIHGNRTNRGLAKEQLRDYWAG